MLEPNERFSVTETMGTSANSIFTIILLLGAAGSFLGGIATFAQYFFWDKGMSATRKKRQHLIVGSMLLVMAAGLFIAWVAVGGTPNEELTQQAWTAYNNHDYELAIEVADECVTTFGRAAEREQARLAETKSKTPPTGKVTDEEANVIFARGILNDAATCYYIKAQSAQSLGRVEEAMAAYRQAEALTYARTWDPQGWFWSPAEAAADRLANIGRNEPDK